MSPKSTVAGLNNKTFIAKGSRKLLGEFAEMVKDKRAYLERRMTLVRSLSIHFFDCWKISLSFKKVKLLRKKCKYSFMRSSR